MKRVIVAMLLVLVWLMSRLPVIRTESLEAVGDSSALAALGFVILGGYIAGRCFAGIGLPQVTGYMLIGLLVGPYLVGILDQGLMNRLKPVEEIALVLIALTAGGELRLGDLRLHLKAISAVLVMQTLIVLLISTAALLLAGGWFIRFSECLDSRQIIIIALILGVMTSANSPSVAVAVITEMKARGRLTNLVMSVTVAKDVFVIILFTLGMTLAHGVMGGTVTGVFRQAHPPLPLLVAGSLLIGILAGWLMVLYLKYIGRQVEIAILVMSVVLIQLIHITSLELLLTAIVIGFIIENYSSQGPRLIKGLERISPPIYIIFFALAGAGVNLPLLLEIGLAAVLWAGLRALGIWLGTSVGFWISGEEFRQTPPRTRGLTWLGYLPQAGVALGMASLVAVSFPGWGDNVRTLVLAVVAINQVVGPIGFRYALVKSGEAENQDNRSN